MSETCPTCGKTVEPFGIPKLGQAGKVGRSGHLTSLTAYWHPGLDSFADVRCNLPSAGAGTVVGCAAVAEALAD